MRLTLAFLFVIFFRQDFLMNPPPSFQGTVQPTRNPSIVQQGAVDLPPRMLPPNPQLAVPQQQPAVQPATQLQGNPAGAMAQAAAAPQAPPQVMTLSQLQQYVLQQGHRLQFTPRQPPQGPQ